MSNWKKEYEVEKLNSHQSMYKNEKTGQRAVVEYRKDGSKATYGSLKGESSFDAGHSHYDYKKSTDTQPRTARTGSDESSKGRGFCYLTTACMKFYSKNFDDNCYELTMMRWLRDNIVSDSDKLLYYLLAPKIVENIDLNTEEKREVIYSYIYDNVLIPCIKLIEQGNYMEAYEVYKNSFMSLAQTFTELPKSSGLKLKKYTF